MGNKTRYYFIQLILRNPPPLVAEVCRHSQRLRWVLFTRYAGPSPEISLVHDVSPVTISTWNGSN